MIKRGLVAFVLLLLAPFVAAYSSTITVDTLPGHTVYISPIDSSNDQIVKTEDFIAGYNGEVEYVFESDLSQFDVLVVVKQGDVRKYREQFGPFSPGEVVEIELLPEDYVDPTDGEEILTATGVTTNETETNETVEEGNETVIEETTTEEGAETDSAVTANVVSGGGAVSAFWDRNSKYVLYGVGAFILLFVVIFATAGIVRHGRKDKFVVKGMKPVKLSPSSFQKNAPDLDNVEKELQRVEAEINNLKKNDRLAQAEQRLSERRKVLEELRSKQASRSSFVSRHPAESPYAAKRFTSSASRTSGSGTTGGLSSLTGDAMKSKENNEKIAAEDEKKNNSSQSP